MRNPTLAKPRVGLNYHRCCAAGLSYECQARALKALDYSSVLLPLKTAFWILPSLAPAVNGWSRNLRASHLKVAQERYFLQRVYLTGGKLSQTEGLPRDFLRLDFARTNNYLLQQS